MQHQSLENSMKHWWDLPANMNTPVTPDEEEYLTNYFAAIQHKLPEDKVNRPSHYTQGGIETIDYLKAKLSTEEFIGYCKGNIFKYLSREALKNGKEDIRKAHWYLNKLVEAA